MKRPIAIALTITTLGIASAGSYFGYRAYQTQQFVAAMSPHAKNASIRLTNALQYEISSGQRITYKELFEKLEADVAEIDKRVLEIQTLETPQLSEKSAPVITYLKAVQETLRAQLAKYRKQLEASNKMDWANRSIERIREADSEFGFKLAKKSSDEALKEATIANNELEHAGVVFADQLEALIKARSAAGEVLSPDTLIDPTPIDKVIKSHRK